MSTPKKDRIAGRPNPKTKSKVTAEIINTVDLSRRTGYFDGLVDRNCVRLDGACDCTTIEECKYLQNEEHLHADTGHLPTGR